MYEICTLCWWEDDGLDDGAEGRPGDLDRESGPNHTTLREARDYFKEHCASEVSGERIIPGMNDQASIENSRRAVGALDALMTVSDADELVRLIKVANEAIGANWRVLMDEFDSRTRKAKLENGAKFSADGYLLTGEDEWPVDRTGVQLRDLSEWAEHLRILKEDEFGLVAKYWEDTVSWWEDSMNDAIRLEMLCQCLESCGFGFPSTSRASIVR